MEGGRIRSLVPRLELGAHRREGSGSRVGVAAQWLPGVVDVAARMEFTVVRVRDSLSGRSTRGRRPTSTARWSNDFDSFVGGSKSARSCNCIVQSMSGRVAAGHPAAGWGQVGQGQAAALWREPAKYGGRGRLVEEAS